MKILKVFGIILVLIGISTIIVALSIKHITITNQDKLIEDYENKINNNLHTLNSQEANAISNNGKPNEEATNTMDNVDNIDTVNPVDTSNILGILVINKIDLKVCVSEGTDMTTLKYAVGHFKNTALPGEVGNFAIAGHRSYAFGEYFNRLDEIENGDKITVNTINGSYSYTVYNKKIVLPEQVEVLNPTSDSTMTLVTCTPVRSATHRLIINARLDK